MEKAAKNEIRLGIFVSVAVAFFIIGIYFVGQRQHLFSNTFRISGIFSDINGLQVGDNVRFSGINVGIISEIRQVTDSTVSVDMTIAESSRQFMKRNVKALIGSDGLMGNKIIQIIPGTADQKELSDNDVIETTQPISIDEIMFKIKVTVDNTALISNDLSAMMLNVREGKGTIGKLVMDSIFAQNVAQALVNIKQGAGGFKQNMDAASHNFLLRGYLKKKEKEKEKELDKEKSNGKQQVKDKPKVKN
ncbi:MAG TPA: MlaD family protein [Cyclobacteriaceae bacterium]|jgi:phospholipid/cholesterol/gamma-HCH transport system substrate-binding protein|nr:MlaD family protein [Cyclobacteriaceae bacterium]